MTITQAGGSWAVSVQKDGKRWRRQFKTHHDAQVWEAQAWAALLAGDPMPGEKTYSKNGDLPYTMLDLAAYQERMHWAAQRGGGKQVDMSPQILRLLGGSKTPIQAITRAAVDALVLDLRATGNKPGTINRKLSCLSSMLTTAVGLGILEEKIKMPWQPKEEPRTRVFSEQELDLLFAGMDKAGYRLESAYFQFLLATGLRRSEAQCLAWVHVDLDEHTLTITKTKTRRTRYLPLSKKALALLQNRCSSRMSSPWGDVETNKATAAWRHGRKAAGLLQDPEAVPHTLRHTFASRLARGGMDLITLRDLLGHTTVEQTMRYAHITAGSSIRARKQLNDAEAP